MNNGEMTMRTSIVTTLATLVLMVVPGCGDGEGTTTNHGQTDAADEKSHNADAMDNGDANTDNDDAGGDGDSATHDAESGAPPVEGPWECIENNVSVNKETGVTRPCGLDKCFPGIGCKNDWRGGLCESDDDCISSTAEAGYAMDCPVWCDITSTCHGMSPWACEDL